MISLKSFINTVHDAVISASDALMSKNLGLLDQYFEPSELAQTDKESNAPGSGKVMVPKTVVLEYPTLGPEGKELIQQVNVPLITLVPLQFGQVEKAVVTAEFDLEEVKGELELNFPSKRKGFLSPRSKANNHSKRATLEITIKPQEMPEGAKIVVDGYERVLRRQIS